MQFKHDSWDFVGNFGALSRDLLAVVLDQSADCVKVLGATGAVEFMNRNGRCAMEIDDFSAVAGKDWASMWPEESRALVIGSVEAARLGKASRFEAFCPTAKGSPRWWDVSVTPVRDDEQALFAILSVSRDVTEQRQAFESLRTMALEMRHRLRNAFAVSSAIVQASGRDEPAHGSFAERLSGRLNSLSAVQASLFDPAQGKPLKELAGRLAESFGGAQVFDPDALPDVLLGEQATRLVALVLGELLTNSLKYGAVRVGRQVTVSGEVAGTEVTLVWREATGTRGGSEPARSEGSGYGLMQQMARIHGGSLEIAMAGGTLEARLTAPIAR